MSIHVSSTAVAVSIVLSVAATPAGAQTKLWTHVGASQSDHLGRSLTFTPDVDGDGVADILAGATNEFPRGNPGHAYVYSGTTSALIVGFSGDAPTDSFGSIVASLGDVDGDGVPEFAIAAPDRVVPGVPLGAIFIYSAAGSILRSFTSASPGGQVGLALSALEDVDGDGIHDLIYGDWSGTAFTVVVVSGATGGTIRTHSDSAFDYGFAVGRAGDTNGDGVDDYAICDQGSPPGHVNVYSGLTGAALFSFLGYETIVRPAGDVDLDGHGDVILANPGSGKVPVVSGATGLALYTISGASWFGKAVSSTSDLDGDGHPDLVVTRDTNVSNPNDIRIYSGANGAFLAEYTIAASRAVDATVDLDGDGIFDIVGGHGDSLNGQFGFISGANGSRIGGVVGVSFAAYEGSSLTVVNDRDGDGHRDVAVVEYGGEDATSGPVVLVRSGFDGQELSRFSPVDDPMETTHDVVLLSDADGDGIDDLAIVTRRFTTVEIRSGLDDSLIRTLTAPSGYIRDIAAARDVNGAPLLAMCTSSASSSDFVFDVSSGTIVTTYGGPGDRDIACVGDVDQDGFVDWVVEESFPSAVRVFSGGPSPTTIWTFNGTSTDDVSCVTGTGDLDGDGIDDVLLGWSGSGPHVTARSGTTGNQIFKLWGPNRSSFGFALTPLGDVNQDGVGDFAVGAPYDGAVNSYTGSVYVYSGATRSLLVRIDGDAFGGYFGYEFAQPRWRDDPSVDPDGIPDLVCGSREFNVRCGRTDVFRLAPLLLQIDPPIAASGQSVTLDTRGGPPGTTAGLYAVAFDGTPIDVFVAFGLLDSIGNWSVSGSVPPGLSGHSLTLRSYTIGFAGKLVASQDQTISFQ